MCKQCIYMQWFTLKKIVIWSGKFFNFAMLGFLVLMGPQT